MKKSTFLLRCTQQELEALHANAKAAGFDSTNAFILSLCAGHDITTPKRDIIPNVISLPKPPAKFSDLCPRCSRISVPACTHCLSKHPPGA